MDSEHIYKQLENVFTYAGKDKIIAAHIAELYKQLEELKKGNKDEPKAKLEQLDLGFRVEYFRYDPDGWILKRESKGTSYRWYAYRDELMGEVCPPWWWEEVYDSSQIKQFEALYSQAQ